MAYTRAQFAEEKGISLATLDALRVYDGKTSIAGHDGKTLVPCVKIPYLTPNGTEYRARVRWNGSKDGHKWGGKPGKPPIPYGLELPISFVDHVWIVEGETDRMALYEAGEPALGIPGASNWKCLRAKYLTPAQTVYCVQEPGSAGEAFPANVVQHLYADGFEGQCLAVQMPGDIKDPRELLQHVGGNIDKFKANLQEAIDNATLVQRPDPALFVEHPENEREGRGPSQCDVLIGLVAELGIELLNEGKTEGEAFAKVPLANGAVAFWEVYSTPFRRFLRNAFFTRQNKGPRAQALADAFSTIEAMASADSAQTVKVYLRVAHEGMPGTPSHIIHIDLGDELWREVKITAQGREIVPHQVCFRRGKGMASLPEPIRGGGPGLLRKHLHLEGAALDEPWTLIASYMTAAIATQRSFCILALIAAQDSGKSCMALMIQLLVDPSDYELIGTTGKDHENILIAADASHLITLDNLSKIDQDLSDTLCRIATGGALRKRKLYTPKDETAFKVEKPLLITAIKDVVSRADLGRRVLIVAPPPLSASKGIRKNKNRLLVDFERDRGRMFGWLCDCVRVAMANWAQAEADMESGYDTSMADYGIAAKAAERMYGVRDGTWERAHKEMTGTAQAVLLEAPLPQAVLAFLGDAAGWEGSATTLLGTLEKAAGYIRDDEKKPKGKPFDWPGGANALSNALKYSAPTLLAAGIAVTFVSRGRGVAKRRLINLSRVEVRDTHDDEGAEIGTKRSTPPTPSSPSLENQGKKTVDTLETD